MHRILLILIVVLCSSVSADVVVLKDGTRIEGDVKKSNEGWSVTTSDGQTVDISADRVKKIELGGANGKASPDQAQASLLSLRRSMENISDLHQIIDRYTTFIKQFKETPAGADAQKDLAMWQDRLDRGLVKLGNHWVTAEERTSAADKALAIADQARQYVAHGRVHDADPILQQALDLDPLCAPALYLRGVVLYQANQIPASRKAFETVTSLISDHAPSLNNIAVILWRQNALPAALTHYDQSIAAAPINKFLLDNVAEALNATPADVRKNKITQDLYRRFIEQDTRLQETMAAKGLYRWGSTWVDRQTIDQFRQVEKEVNDKIAVVKTDADAADKRVKEIDAQVSSIQESMRQIELQSVYRDPDGRLVRMPYTQQYFDLQNDEAKLQGERGGLVAKLEHARSQIKQLQAQLPKPKFTGVQQLIGAEGTPVMVLPPATQPASQPS